MDSMPNEPDTGSATQQVSQQLQDAVDRVYETHAEHPEDQVRAALEHQTRDLGVELSDEMLDRMSTEIASGNRVEIGPV